MTAPARLDLAYAENGSLFLFAEAAAMAPLTVEIAGQAHAAAAHHRREGSDLLIAMPYPGRPKAGSVVRLRMGDGSVAEARLGRDRAAFDAVVARHGAALRRLLGGIARADAYALEAVAWPETAAREEQTDLERLNRHLHFEIDTCCVPVPGCLVGMAWLDDPEDAITSIDVFHGDGDTPFERRLFRFQRPDPPPGQRDRLRISDAIAIVLDFDETIVTDDDFVLLIATRTMLWTRTLRPRGRLERGLRAIEPHLRRLEPNVQMLILEQIVAVGPGQAGRLSGDQALLVAMRDFAIGQLPEEISRGDLGVRLALDLSCTVGQVGVFLLGWALLEEDAVQSIAFCTGAGVRHEISRTWVTNSRLDVLRRLRDQAIHSRSDRLGFICFVPTPIDASVSAGYLVVQMVDGATLRMRVTLYFSAEDPLDAIKPVLTSFAQTHHDLGRLLDLHVGPAVSAVWARRRGGATGVDVVEYGMPGATPEASVVIPIYGRCDFIEFQVASFADDPDMRRHEVLFVIDDPAIYDEARLLAHDVEKIFRFPFRLVYGRRNLGFSGATNLGASLARGRTILMMNSDVLPRRPGWLSDLAAAHGQLPQAGAVSPVLLYDDGSIQHAGMVFARYPLWAGMWVNEHPGKGLPKLPMPAPFECIAVTGACLMMSAALWREVGGLGDEFIIGDFEDSDLCMRLRARGLRNWVVPGVELTHLERQSQDLIGDAAWRTNLTLFNCWTHHRKWDAAISAGMAASR